MANLSQTIKSDIRAIPRHFRGVIPKLIVLIHVVVLLITGLYFWEIYFYRVSKGWHVNEWEFLSAYLLVGVPSLIPCYLLLTQRLKWALTISLVGLVALLLFVLIYENLAGVYLLFYLVIIGASILDLIILWTWKPAWRPQLATEADAENYYEEAWAELNADNIQQGLWAKLYTANKGNIDKTKAAYLKARVQQLRDAEDVEAGEEDAERDARKETVEGLFRMGKDAFVDPTERKDRKVKIVALVVSVCLFGYYLYYQSDDSSTSKTPNNVSIDEFFKDYNPVSKSKDSTGSNKQVSEGNSVSLPYNGKFRSFTSSELLAPLKVNASSGSNFFVKLAYPGNTNSVVTLFIRSGLSAKVKVPLGTYEFRYATGDVWYGEQRLFGQDTIYNKADTLMTFQRTSSGYNGHAVTLRKVAGGNLRTRRIGKDKF